jgi:hypothetical protein
MYGENPPIVIYRSQLSLVSCGIKIYSSTTVPQ